MNKTIAIIVLALLLLGSVVYNVRLSSDSGMVGSITTGQEYYSASTDHLGITSNQLIKGGYGSLAQVTVTGAGTSAFTLYDATSTNFAEVTAKTSSTQQLAVIPASLVAGTYTFDVTYNDGLYIYFDTVGTAPTTTISYR